MRLIIIIIGMSIATSLQAQEFKLIEATAQKWAGGQARTGHGVNYKLTVVFSTNARKLSFEKLWVGKEVFPLKLVKNINNKNVNSFSKNDTVYLTARKRVKTNEYGDEIKEDKEMLNPPFDYQGAALLEYKFKRKNKHKIIEQLKELEPLFYP